jgi:thiol-disulfide isomerase/thioredoxin
MQVKHLGRWIPVLVIVVFAVGWKTWQHQAQSRNPQASQVKGPAVILFRGDNDPDCQAVYRLVQQAAAQDGKRIQFLQLNKASDSPLVREYKVRFLPTVVFVDSHDKEVRRVVGESPSVRKELGQALAQIKTLVEQ